MTIASPPNRGYADYQRVQAWDSAALWQPGPTLGPPNVVSPVMDVSRYAYLGGFIGVVSGSFLVTINWYLDATGFVSFGTRQFTVTDQIASSPQIRLPNLAPFARIVISSLSGANFQVDPRVIGTNRYHPCEFVPVQPVLVDVQGIPLPASSNVPVSISGYYSGPITLSTFIAQNGHVSLDYLTSAGVWDIAYEETLPANTRAPAILIAPPGAWRINFWNDTANASTFFARVIPSLTGSS